MEETLFDIEVEFELADEVGEDDAADLIAELRELDVTAGVTERHAASPAFPALVIVAIIAVSMTTVAGLAATVVFLHRAFRCGVMIDLRGERYRVKKDKELPLGSILILYADGKQDFREAIPSSEVGAVLRSALTSAGSNSG